MSPPYLELVCPAGTPAALTAAIDAGADTVYCGFRDCTNARNYPGLNFTPREMAEGVRYAHARGRKLLCAINTYARAGEVALWRKAVDAAAGMGVDAVILADIGLLDYAQRAHPDLRLHLSVQAAAANPVSIGYYRDRFNVKRVVFPRILSVAEVAELILQIGIEAEVFAFGSVGTMVEGRCFLSSYITGISPSSDGACAPASHVSYEEKDGAMISKLGKVVMNRFAANDAAAYPTPCKGTYVANGKASFLFEEPVGLNALDILPELKKAGVTALKIEGRQRGKAYVTRVVRAFRKAIDARTAGADESAAPLNEIVEGGKVTVGAYRKGWR